MEFEEEGHRYTWHHPIHGPLYPKSVSSVLVATEAKTFNLSSWRQQLIAKGPSEGMAEALEAIWPGRWPQGVPLEPQEADVLMKAFCDHRAQVGTDFHLLVQEALLQLGRGREVLAEAVVIFQRWLDRFYRRIGRVWVVEQPMIHRRYFITGTPDLIAEVDGVVSMVDWKSQQNLEKARVRQEWILQQVAYIMLAYHCHEVDCPEIMRGINVMPWTTGEKEKIWNFADLANAERRFYGFLREYLALRAFIGCEHHLEAYHQLCGDFKWSDDELTARHYAEWDYFYNSSLSEFYGRRP